MIGDPKKKRIKRKRKAAAASIIQKKTGQCLLCMILDKDFRKKEVLHEHHIFGGCRRDVSTELGLTCYLCPDHHVLGPSAVHQNRFTMHLLQELAQKEYEKSHSRKEWMDAMHKNYIDNE